MPFHFGSGSSRRLIFSCLRWRLDLNTLQRPTDETPEKPVHHSENNKSLFLTSREMAAKNVDQGDYSAY